MVKRKQRVKRKQKFDVTLIGLREDKTAYNAVREFVRGTHYAYVDIEFHRFVRNADGVPDVFQLVPIYPIDEYDGEEEVPNDVITKGGILVPIHEHENIRIVFRGDHDFALKVLADRINTLSGVEANPYDAPSVSDWCQGRDNLQDYIVTRLQETLEVLTSADGRVRQLKLDTPGPLSSPLVSDLQLELMPVQADKFCININTPPNPKPSFPHTGFEPWVKPCHTTVNSIKSTVFDTHGVRHVYQRVEFEGKELIWDDPIIYHGVKENGKLYDIHLHDTLTVIAEDQPVLFHHRRGPFEAFELGSGGDDSIRQKILRDPIAPSLWDMERRVLFNVHFLQVKSVDRPNTEPQAPRGVFSSVVETAGKLGSFIGWKNRDKEVMEEHESEAGAEEDRDDDGNLPAVRPVVTLPDPMPARDFLMISELENLKNFSDLPCFG